MKTQDNVVTYQVQSMTSQVNREIEPRVSQPDNSMAYHLRDFTRLNQTLFFGLRFDEDP